MVCFIQLLGVRRSPPTKYQISATETTMEIVRLGQFPSEDLPYLALDLLNEGSWERIATHLRVLVLSSDEESDDYERCYKMLKTWLNKGRGASYEELAGALKNLRMQSILGNYCLEGHHPPLRETVATNPSDMKQGRVGEEDFLNISNDIQAQRYRLGRALGLEDSELTEIRTNKPRKSWEQSYQILRKWHSAKYNDATYTTLAKALRDRTVSLEKVVEKFCLVGST